MLPLTEKAEVYLWDGYITCIYDKEIKDFPFSGSQSDRLTTY